MKDAVWARLPGDAQGRRAEVVLGDPEPPLPGLPLPLTGKTRGGGNRALPVSAARSGPELGAGLPEERGDQACHVRTQNGW